VGSVGVWSTGIPRSRDDEAPENVTGIPRSRDDEALENAAARISTLERMNRCAAFAPQQSETRMSMARCVSSDDFSKGGSHQHGCVWSGREPRSHFAGSVSHFLFRQPFFLFRQRGLSHAHPLAGLAVEAARRK
jgi:hypothetical protein